MDPKEVVFRTDPRTVHEEMLYQIIERCCGSCPSWFHHWGQLLETRSNGLVRAHRFMDMTVAEFEAAIARCEEGMNDGTQVEKVVRAIDQGWKYDYRRHKEPSPGAWDSLREQLRDRS